MTATPYFQCFPFRHLDSLFLFLMTFQFDPFLEGPSEESVPLHTTISSWFFERCVPELWRRTKELSHVQSRDRRPSDTSEKTLRRQERGATTWELSSRSHRIVQEGRVHHEMLRIYAHHFSDSFWIHNLHTVTKYSLVKEALSRWHSACHRRIVILPFLIFSFLCCCCHCEFIACDGVSRQNIIELTLSAF